MLKITEQFCQKINQSTLSLLEKTDQKREGFLSLGAVRAILYDQFQLETESIDYIIATYFPGQQWTLKSVAETLIFIQFVQIPKQQLTTSGKLIVNELQFSNIVKEACLYLQQADKPSQYLLMRLFRDITYPNNLLSFADFQSFVTKTLLKDYRPPEVSCRQEIIEANQSEEHSSYFINRPHYSNLENAPLQSLLQEQILSRIGVEPTSDLNESDFKSLIRSVCPKHANFLQSWFSQRMMSLPNGCTVLPKLQTVLYVLHYVGEQSLVEYMKEKDKLSQLSVRDYASIIRMSFNILLPVNYDLEVACKVAMKGKQFWSPMQYMHWVARILSVRDLDFCSQ